MLEPNGELTDSARPLLRDMERYAAGVGCRHRALVELLRRAPTTTADCGACDWCLGELEAVAEPVDRSRRRSCRAWRAVGQRFGAATSPTSCAASERAVTTRGHHALSARSGCCKDCAARRSARLHRAAHARGLAAARGRAVSDLQLTAEGRELMRGRRGVRAPPSTSAAGAAAYEARHDSHIEWWPQGRPDEALLGALRALRLSLARERRVPAYVIFHDATLVELGDELVRLTLAALREVVGIGERKAATFGAQILEVIASAAPRPERAAHRPSANMSIACPNRR